MSKPDTIDVVIIITGTIAYDYIMNFPGLFGDHILPDQIHNINLSFTVNKFAKRRGGTAGNTSYTLGLLKTPHILFSFAGKDFLEYKKHFKKIGINVNNVLVDKSMHSSTGFAMTDSKDNQIWGFFPGASEKISQLKLKKIAQKNDFVLIGPSGKTGTMAFINQSIELGIRYMLDLGFTITQIDNNDLSHGLSYASYVIGNDYEITLMKQKLKRWKKILSDKVLITTLGEKGAVIQTPDKIYKIQAAKPKKVVDPTGAGDAWRGGFLAGLQRGFNFQICGQMGAIAAVYAVENYGSQEHKYTELDFEERYRQNFGSLLKLHR